MGWNSGSCPTDTVEIIIIISRKLPKLLQKGCKCKQTSRYILYFWTPKGKYSSIGYPENVPRAEGVLFMQRQILIGDGFVRTNPKWVKCSICQRLFGVFFAFSWSVSCMFLFLEILLCLLGRCRPSTAALLLPLQRSLSLCRACSEMEAEEVFLFNFQIWQMSDMSTTDWMVETQLCKLRRTSIFHYNMVVFVN